MYFRTDHKSNRKEDMNLFDDDYDVNKERIKLRPKSRVLTAVIFIGAIIYVLIVIIRIIISVV